MCLSLCSYTVVLVVLHVFFLLQCSRCSFSMMVYFELMMVKCSLMMVKCSSLRAKQSFAHLTIIKKLHRLQFDTRNTVMDTIGNANTFLIEWIVLYCKGRFILWLQKSIKGSIRNRHICCMIHMYLFNYNPFHNSLPLYAVCTDTVH